MLLCFFLAFNYCLIYQKSVHFMKLSTLSLSAVMLATTGTSALAYDFNDKFYGKMTAGIDYSLEHSQGDMLDMYDWEKDMDSEASQYSHNLGVNVGYNVYYKATSLIHPFAGLEITARIPLKNRMNLDVNYYNHASFNFKAGLKFNQVVKNFSLQPYAIFGVAILNYKNTNADDTNAMIDDINARDGLGFGDRLEYLKKNDILPAINYGVGIETIYDLSDNLSLTGGFEYKRIRATKKTRNNNIRLETDQFSFKFGVQFL